MSDLNKKNINYGALNRFYQDLKSHDISTLNDRIDNINVPEYVAGDGITIDSSSMTISCTVKPIADVSALPDAEGNKDSVLRLEGDEQVYISKAIDMGTTDRLSDAQQIGLARFYNTELSEGFYQGLYTIRCSDGDIQGYLWMREYNGSVDDVVITNNNAETLVLDASTSGYILKMGVYDINYVNSIDTTNKIIYVSLSKSLYLNLFSTIEYNGSFCIATYNATNSEQTDKAYLKIVDDHDFTRQYPLFYENITVNVDGVDYYLWGNASMELATTIPANEIYKYSRLFGEAPLAYSPSCTVYTYNSDNNTITGGVPSGYQLGGLSEATLGDIEGVYIVPEVVPDLAQINNAYIVSAERNPYINNTPSSNWYVGVYKGEITLTTSDETLDLYAWFNSSSNKYYFTDTNAVNTTIHSTMYRNNNTTYITKVDDTHYELRNNSDNTLASSSTLYMEELYDSVYVAICKPYEHPINNWQWKKVVTEDELDSLEARIYALEHPNS